MKHNDTVQKKKIRVYIRVARDLESIHLTTPPSQSSRIEIFPSFFFCTICVTIYRRRIPSHQGFHVTSHFIPCPTYCTWYCSRLLRGCTRHGRVVNGHKILACTRKSAWSSRRSVQPGIPWRNVWVSNTFRGFSTVACWTCIKKVTGGVSMTPGAVIYIKNSGCFPWWILVARVYTSAEDTRFLSNYMLFGRQKETYTLIRQAWQLST